ncbi:FmdB family zinc ribbon protein [Synechococcus sp. UW179A]|uniref:FmdB family zinc ribbon protein n=1 Tax=Synechococcus sp. UW179A TaxID=2575510 RepID=UPI000E0F2018|nr:FmdB family zinc ribbon protein [Synechococcus sp. UW179A]
MPIYEFLCEENNCGQYEIWATIQDRSKNTLCPKCGGAGQRVYSPPLTLTGTLRLKTSTKEPKLVRGEDLIDNRVKPRLKQSDSRPWMLNRGC